VLKEDWRGVMDRCYFCGSKVEEKTICHAHQWEKKIFIFKNVLAEVCTQCGEIYFGPGALEKMDMIVSGAVEPEEVSQVLVYSL
jgi:YgiT-type zinc finger domain-containing protein